MCIPTTNYKCNIIFIKNKIITKTENRVKLIFGDVSFKQATM